MFEALIASVFVALLSLSGVFLFRKSGYMTGTHRYMLPFAVGVFLGIVLFELIPETIEMSHEWGPVAIAAGFLGFYLLSYFLNTFHHHHHETDGCVNCGGARKLLIGDGVHNIADGIVITTAFLIDPTLGVVTTFGIALHEIPQEIAEFGVLLASGYSKKKAAFYNLLSASSIVLGVLLTLAFAETFGQWLFILTGLAAGNLLYIATADLLPELRDSHKGHFWQTFLATLFGMVLIALLLNLTHGDHTDEHYDEEIHETHLQDGTYERHMNEGHY